MVLTHNLGFPRIGENRELKFALEKFWKGEMNETKLQELAKDLRLENWVSQSSCDLLPVGDFSLYDQVLDMSFILGNLPHRLNDLKGNELDNYFRMARGRSANNDESQCVRAGEMTKWFDTNYHYIVPELTGETEFCLNFERLLIQVKEAQALNYAVKPVIIGPVTYLWLSKCKDDSQPLDYLDDILKVYQELLAQIKQLGVDWVQIDEPILVTKLGDQWQQAFNQSYKSFEDTGVKILLSTYFGSLQDNLSLASDLPVAGLHLDVINAKQEVNKVLGSLTNDQVLSLGVIDGRNVWKTDLNATLDWLEPIAKSLGDRLWIAPSCSLLHVPVDLNLEENINTEVLDWLSFAKQKLTELETLKLAINQGREAVKDQLNRNQNSINLRKASQRVHNASIKAKATKISERSTKRQSVFEERIKVQQAKLNLPIFPTTSIGSFPQTKEIRRARLQYKKGQLEHAEYKQLMHNEIRQCIKKQEQLGLDVLVHGEAERNDMVEYFGEQLDGYTFSEFGWVQSYGSRCVKPPILYGDISRAQTMTVDWIEYAQSLTKKPLKGMLTGAVTMLNWSFVRDDQPRKETCFQLALAIREEVLELEKAGIPIIQIDEAALREGLPLRESEWQEYLNWAIKSFQICANDVQDQTQIHTHMCYSEFNDIISDIASMDADVITIETSRSDMELLDVFDEFKYPNQIGPGVYDIHSPNTPEVGQIVNLIDKASTRIPKERLWINPDCGLKTRQWDEVMPALNHMVLAATELRKQVNS